MGIFELNLTMVVVFLLLAIIPSELYVFGNVFVRSKLYRKALPSRCSSQLELSGKLSPISGLFLIVAATPIPTRDIGGIPLLVLRLGIIHFAD